MKIAVAALVALACAACSHEVPQAVGAPPPGIAYRLDNGNTAATAERADHYCAQFGKHAHLEGVNENGGPQIAQYACS